MTENLIHPLDQKPVDTGVKQTPAPMAVVPIIVLVVLLGLGSGYVLSRLFGSTGMVPLFNTQNGLGNFANAKTYGTKNTKLFPDSAEGILKVGGINSEGTHHLERPGGQSQYVYITSSSIDLSIIVGRKIKVWGKTYAAQTAGWLMDVGYLEVE